MKNFKINKDVAVVCDARDTRTGFKHTATLLLGGNSVEEYKVFYHNRTWERYQYETILNKVCHNTKLLNDKEKQLFLNLITYNNFQD